jgi:anti-anti-sigma regulatory factor
MSGEVHVDVDHVGTRTVTRLTGELTMSSAAAVRLALVKCLVDQPDALLVDVGALTVVDPVALVVFNAVARQASMWPGTPVVICGPDAATAASLTSRGYGRYTVFPSVAQALVTPPERQMRSVSDVILPIRGAARRARDLVTETCIGWDLPDMVGPACLVTSEFVTNAVEHAGTMMTIRVSRRRRYLSIAVSDGSPELPRLGHTDKPAPYGGRGLRIVESVAWRWGSLPTDDGKVVWAMVSLPRATGDRP